MRVAMRILTFGLMVTLAASARADVFNMGGGQTSISLVPVGNPGNADDHGHGRPHGSVGYNYSIDKYDVTLGQYTEFLNAVAKTDTYGLYNSYMGTDYTHAGHPADWQSWQLQLLGHWLEPAGRELPGV